MWESDIAMSKGINHIVLTRFNLPTKGVESYVRAKEGWLRERIDLFDRYCVPSLAQQTCQDFRWIVYLDPASPTWLLDRIGAHAEGGLLAPVLRESVSTEDLLSDILQVVDRKEDVLVTTNVDNDDGVAVDFIQRIQAVQPESERVAIYLTEGLVRSSGGLYRLTYGRNAFNSVRESWADPVTSWSEWHTELGEKMPVVEIGGAPTWLQVVHGSNVSNRVKGRLVSPRPYLARFGTLLDGIPEPSRRDLAIDAVLRRPVRAVRDAGRAAAKRVIISLFGRTGLDRVKQMGARRGRAH